VRRSSNIKEQCLCEERKSHFLDNLVLNCLDKDFKRMDERIAGVCQHAEDPKAQAQHDGRIRDAGVCQQAGELKVLMAV
jgi:hypothetical protein